MKELIQKRRICLSNKICIGKKCFECESNKNLQEHYVIPKSRGGRKTIFLCEKCHSKVHGHKMRTSFLTKEGLRKKREKGLSYSKNPPFGFCKKDGKLVEDSEEQFIIQEIRKLRMLGLKQRVIVEKMKEKGFSNRNGNSFSQPQISKILKCFYE